MTIRTKLILLYSGLLGTVIIVFGLGVFAVVRQAWIETVDSTLRESADQIIDNSTSALISRLGALRVEVFIPPLDVFRASGVLVQSWRFDEDNSIQLEDESDNLRGYDKPLDPNVVRSEVTLFTNVLINDTEFRVLTVPYIIEGQDDVWGTLQFGNSLATINRATSRLTTFIIVGGGLSMLISFGLGTWLSNQALRPIAAITQAADNISTAKDLQTRLSWNGPMDELGQLTTVFNRMLDRLEQLFNVQTRLVADVSHELRTPLTAIRGNVELIKRYGMDPESMDAIQSEAARMSRLVDDVLLLARADHGSLNMEMHEVDLDTVLAEVYREARVLAKDRQLALKMAQIEPVRLQGNADRLKQLLFNLVNNAIKFTPDGGTIFLSLRREGTEAVLQVTDTGIGIQADELEHIFDRFYQADSSRVRVNNSGGAGLGLAIAKWVTEAHQGTIRVESKPGVFTTFSVHLPLPEAEHELSMNGYGNGNGHRAATLPASAHRNLGFVRKPNPTTKSTDKVPSIHME
jgi:signal transduction histidine kinase